MFYQILTWAVSIFLIICVYGFGHEDGVDNKGKTSMSYFIPGIIAGIAAIALVKYCPC